MYDDAVYREAISYCNLNTVLNLTAAFCKATT